MEAINLGPSLVWKFQYNFTERYISNIINPANLSDIPLEGGDAKSSILDKENQPHKNIMNSEFLDWLNEKIRFVFTQWEYPNKLPFYIWNSWVNVHGKTGITNEHNHSLVNMAIVSYLKCPINSGNILFRDPIHNYRCMEPILTGSNPWREVPVKTGDVLFFPGWLYHMTQPNLVNDNRIVATYNIRSKLDLINI